MHQPPLAEGILLQLHLAAFNRVEDVLGPGDQQPDDGDLLLGNRLQYPPGLDPAQQHRPAAREQTAEPVHLGAGMVQRRNAEEIVAPRLAVMMLLGHARRGQAAVGVQDGLGETGGAGREVQRRLILVGDVDPRRGCGTIGRQPVITLGKGWAIGADEDPLPDPGHPVADRLDPADEFGPEHQQVGLGQVETVGDLLGGVAVVQRHRHRPGPQDTEIQRQPLQAVHQQQGDLVTFVDIFAHQQIGTAGCHLVELAPCHLPAVG